MLKIKINQLGGGTMNIDEAISEIKSIIHMMVDKTTKRTNDLEKRVERIERDVARYLKIASLLLVLSSIIHIIW